jgi:Dolichyl-phosphate-mannose-protein mannosyltransferase
LIVAAITHLWNPIGFPGIHYDEGIYMRRSMHVLEALGPLDPLNQFDHTQESTSSYDHPFFGQLFLASALSVLNYPHSFISDSTLVSIQNIYLVPRLIMGLLAIFDTFLVYKIANVRYNKNTAFIASMLFAAMPLTWLLNRIVLDSIQLPFLLASVLFAIYCSKKPDVHRNGTKIALLALSSGIFLGVSIFTKLPAVTMIPLVALLVCTNFRSDPTTKLKLLGIWFIPVILIPMIWPVHSLSAGQFNEWLDGLIFQGTERQDRGLIFAFNVLWEIDPLLLLLGIAGIIFAAFRRDFFFVLWFVPYLVLIHYVGWVTHFHWIMLFPVLCIAASYLILNLPNTIASRVNYNIINRSAFRQLLIFSLFFVTVGFGLASTATMISTDVSSHQYKTAEFILEKVRTIPQNGSISYRSIADKSDVTIISSPMYSWLFVYPFSQKYVLSWFRDSSQSIHTQNVLLAVDQFYKGWIKRESGEDQRQIQIINSIYNRTNLTGQFKAPIITYDREAYPFTGLGQGRIGASDVEIRTNY